MSPLVVLDRNGQETRGVQLARGRLRAAGAPEYFPQRAADRGLDRLPARRLHEVLRSGMIGVSTETVVTYVRRNYPVGAVGRSLMEFLRYKA